MNTQKLLTTTKADRTLYAYLKEAHALELCEKHNTFNRGDFFEMAITKEAVKRSGLHEVSKGDYILNGEAVEIKYLTKKTSASKDLKGTICNFYLIGFNDGATIELRLIHKSELVTTLDGKREKIKFQDNYTKGKKLN